MEIIYKEREPKPELYFPVLMKHKSSELIVLFISSSSGVVLRGNNVNKIGYYSDSIIKSTDTIYWEKFTGEIILKND